MITSVPMIEAARQTKLIVKATLPNLRLLIFV